MKYIFYTFHRSGSTFVENITKDICNHKKIKYVFDNDHVDINKTPDNTCFFSRSQKLPNSLDNTKVTINIRDPRDVMTSMFYSYCYYHSGSISPKTGKRLKMSQKGIDFFTIKILLDKKGIHGYGTGNEINIKTKYEHIVNNLIPSPNFSLLKYEKMVLNFDYWLDDLFMFFDTKNDNFKTKLISKYGKSFSVKKENQNQHKRKVTPGDYKSKLSSETITKVNNELNEILNKLDYDIN